MIGWAAVEANLAGMEKPALGALRFEGRTVSDLGGGTRDSGMQRRERQADMHKNQLNRDYQVRRNGYDRYNNINRRRATGGGYRGGRRR
ncbi:MAG: hypothetical protein OER85_05235 [Gammaproteobacteria bacterium]|nr:hypothetical protein [Gammaproteobacteria bacterium]